jgi:hypothetical protein
MFQRIITGDPEAICTIIAFAVAASIFLAVAWRALRMQRTQTDRLAELPFDTPTPAARRESAHENTAP